MSSSQDDLYTSSVPLKSTYSQIPEFVLRKKFLPQKWSVEFKVLNDGRGQIHPIPGTFANIQGGESKKITFQKIGGAIPTMDGMKALMSNQSEIYLEDVIIEDVPFQSVPERTTQEFIATQAGQQANIMLFLFGLSIVVFLILLVATGYIYYLNVILIVLFGIGWFRAKSRVHSLGQLQRQQQGAPQVQIEGTPRAAYVTA